MATSGSGGLWSTRNNVAADVKAAIIELVPQLHNRNGANAEADVKRALDKLKKALNNFDNPVEGSTAKVSTIFDASSALSKVKTSTSITIETIKKEHGGDQCTLEVGDLIKLRDDKKREQATVSGLKMGTMLGCAHVFGSPASKVVHDDEGIMKELDDFTLAEIETAVTAAAVRISETDKVKMKIEALKSTPNYQQPLSEYSTKLDKLTSRLSKSGVTFGPDDKAILMLSALETAARESWGGQSISKAHDELRAAYTSDHIHDSTSYAFILQKAEKADKNRLLADAPAPDEDGDTDVANEAYEADQGWEDALFEDALSGSDSSVDSRRTNRTRASKKSAASTRSRSRRRGYDSDSGSETSSGRSRSRRSKTTTKADKKKGKPKNHNSECVWCNVVGQEPPHPRGITQETGELELTDAELERINEFEWTLVDSTKSNKVKTQSTLYNESDQAHVNDDPTPAHLDPPDDEHQPARTNGETGPISRLNNSTRLQQKYASKHSRRKLRKKERRKQSSIDEEALAAAITTADEEWTVLEDSRTAKAKADTSSRLRTAIDNGHSLARPPVGIIRSAINAGHAAGAAIRRLTKTLQRKGGVKFATANIERTFLATDPPTKFIGRTCDIDMAAKAKETGTI
ncbi:hypothetical protein THAOC_01918, partial [Thalassiosira oceanica]